MSDDPRPVWVSEEHAAYIDRYLGGFKAKWDAAPADSTEAISNAVVRVEWDTDLTGAIANAVLRALGMPEPKDAEPTPREAKDNAAIFASYQCGECGETFSNPEARDRCDHGDWPMPQHDPVTEDARLLIDEADAVESFLRAGPGNPYGERDWPMPEPPPYPADDEGSS